MNGRPDPSEHAEYYGKYVALVPGEDVRLAFDAETASTHALLDGLTGDQSLHRYAPEKWSIRETVLHVADCERVWVYRALRFARVDPTPLEGFESDGWVPHSDADERTWPSILAEYADVRRATISFFRGLPSDAWLRTGMADGNRSSVRALAYMILGHDIHHRTLIRERYLGAAYRR